jgi:hypothetical protein
MSTINGHNGHRPVEPDVEVDDVALYSAELTRRSEAFLVETAQAFAVQIATEEALQEELSELLEASRARSKRMRKAMDSLTNTSSTATTLPTKKKARKRSSGDNWSISDKKVDEVLHAIHGLGEGATFTASILGKAEGLSPDTARKAIEVLREREVVRFVSTTRGGGKLFALMPEHTGVQLEVVA